MTDVLSPVELAELRALTTELSFADTFQVERDTSTPDGMGGETVATTIVGAGPCALSVGGGRVTVVGGRAAHVGTHTVELPLATDVTPRDVLIVNGRRMEIAGVRRGGAHGLSTLAYCNEIT